MSNHTVDRYLKACLEIFTEDGPAGITLTTVSKRARYSRSNHQNHFVSKEHLLLDSLEFGVKQHEAVAKQLKELKDPKMMSKYMDQDVSHLYRFARQVRLLRDTHPKFTEFKKRIFKSEKSIVKIVLAAEGIKWKPWMNNALEIFVATDYPSSKKILKLMRLAKLVQK